MPEINEFFDQLKEAVHESWYHNAPKIELRGWWWKKYIPHYRRLKQVMQLLLDRVWVKEKDEIEKSLEKMVQEEMDNLCYGIRKEYK